MLQAKYQESCWFRDKLEKFIRPSNSMKGRGQRTHILKIIAPLGNQSTKRQNKHQPIVSEETGLLDSFRGYLFRMLRADFETLTEKAGFSVYHFLLTEGISQEAEITIKEGEMEVTKSENILKIPLFKSLSFGDSKNNLVNNTIHTIQLENQKQQQGEER